MPKHTLNCCRFYKNRVPSVGELVMATVKKFDKNVGFYVELDEYEGCKALLTLLHTVKKRARKSLTSIIPINSKQVVSVISVSDDGFNIDVSRNNINNDEFDRFIQFFTQEKQLNSAMRKLSYLSKKPILDLYQNIVWNNFSKNYNEDAPIRAIDQLFHHLDDILLDDDYRDALTKHHYTIFGPVIHTLKKTFTMVSFENDGSIKVSKALKELIPDKKFSKKELNADISKYNTVIRPIALPKYEAVITSSSIKTNSEVLSQIKSALKLLVVDDAGYLDF